MTLNGHLASSPSSRSRSRDDWSHFYPDYVTERLPGARLLGRRHPRQQAVQLRDRRACRPPRAAVGRSQADLRRARPGPTRPPSRSRPEPARQWNGIQTAQAAAAEDPARRGDPQRHPRPSFRRNREIERARDIVSRAATDQVGTRASARSRSRPTRPATGAALPLGPVRRRNWGPAYATYHRLKVRGVVDYLATARRARGAGVQRRLGRRARGALPRPRVEGRAVLGAARRRGTSARTELLLEFSLPYRWRRLSFVLKKLGPAHPQTTPRWAGARARGVRAEADRPARRLPTPVGVVSRSCARGSPRPSRRAVRRRPQARSVDRTRCRR